VRKSPKTKQKACRVSEKITGKTKEKPPFYKNTLRYLQKHHIREGCMGAAKHPIKNLMVKMSNKYDIIYDELTMLIC